MESSSQSKWVVIDFVQEGGRDLCYQNLAPTEVLLSHSQPRHKNSGEPMFVSALAPPCLCRDMVPTPAMVQPHN